MRGCVCVCVLHSESVACSLCVILSLSLSLSLSLPPHVLSVQAQRGVHVNNDRRFQAPGCGPAHRMADSNCLGVHALLGKFGPGSRFQDSLAEWSKALA